MKNCFEKTFQKGNNCDFQICENNRLVILEIALSEISLENNSKNAKYASILLKKSSIWE